jgi:hypothetical protein
VVEKPFFRLKVKSEHTIQAEEYIECFSIESHARMKISSKRLKDLIVFAGTIDSVFFNIVIMQKEEIPGLRINL